MLAMALSIAVVVTGLAASAPAVQAANASDFDPGYIISDANFYERDAMSQAEIQAFLEAKTGPCSNANCLPALKVDTFDRPANNPCSAYQGAMQESAAAIIYKVQHACGISARALLVTLHKEQGLIGKKAPSDLELRKAMGYGCPDTASCDARYYGFYNQMYNAAWQFGWYRIGFGTPGSSFYGKMPPGQVSAVRFHPNIDCGSSPVVIYNFATAALYHYTPYQPNAAALANLSGTGDACSSYGNRNFWRMYSDWFGSPVGNPNPVGTIDLVSPTPGAIRVLGWAFDSNSTDPIAIHAYVDGAYAAGWAADLPRADVKNAHPGQGDRHGFDFRLPVSDGTHQTCLYALNVGPGKNTLLGCSTVTVVPSTPNGWLDSIAAAGDSASLIGWAFDPATATPVSIHVYVDGRFASGFSASSDRPDVQRAFNRPNAALGFEQTLALSPGPHNVCAYALNSASTKSIPLGCRTVTAVASVPIGNLDTVAGVAGGVRVHGWTFDPSTTVPVDAHIYVDGAFASGFTANVQRTDVQAAYVSQGANHGFDHQVATASGTRTVCAYGLNAAHTASVLLGCRTVYVP